MTSTPSNLYPRHELDARFAALVESIADATTEAARREVFTAAQTAAERDRRAPSGVAWWEFLRGGGRRGYSRGPLPVDLVSVAGAPALVRLAREELAATPMRSVVGAWLAGGGWEALWSRSPITVGAQMPPVDGHVAAVRALALASDGVTAVSTSDDGAIIAWDSAKGAALSQTPRELLPGFVLHTDGREAVVLGDECLAAIDVASGSVIDSWDSDHGLDGAACPPVVPNAVTRDGRRIVLAYPIMVLFDLDKGIALGGELLELEDGPAEACVLALTRDDRRLVAGNERGALSVWDLVERRCLRSLGAGGGAVRTLALSPDGRLAATGDGGVVRVWDLETGVQLRAIPAHEGGITALTFDASGGVLASGGADAMVRVWDVLTGELLASCGGLVGAVRRVAFAAGVRSVVADDGASVRVWDARDGSARGRWSPGGRFDSAVVSAGGVIVVGDEGGTVWFVAPDVG